MESLERIDGKHILVFDWGGGTLDITLVVVRDGVMTQLGTADLGHRAGDYFDQKLMRLSHNRFLEESKLAQEEATIALGLKDRYLAECERVKIELSKRQSEDLEIASAFRFNGRHYDVSQTILREDLEAEIQIDIHDSIYKVDTLLEDARLTSRDVDLVLLIGGSSQHQVLRVKYHSLSRGAATREVIPHALVDSGLRWHTRVFDRQNGEFRDLVISRIETAVPLPGTEIHSHEMAQADKEWNRLVDLALIVHPGVKRPEIVQHDFGMRRGELHLTVRAAIAGYILQLWNVDCSPSRSLDSTIHRLCLKNRAAIKGITSIEIAPGYVGVGEEKS